MLDRFFLSFLAILASAAFYIFIPGCLGMVDIASHSGCVEIWNIN